MFGFLNVNKPRGPTSRDIVNQVQKQVRPVKVGHAGTLDPLATGVLVLCVGPATRLARFVQAHRKTYDATFQLGLRSDTLDVDGDVVEVEDAKRPLQSALETALANFVGEIGQTPPKYSALKVNGKRAHRLARANQPVELKERRVTVYRLELVDYSYPSVRLLIECSGGTYVRSLGSDLGKSLGSDAVMSQLTRTAIGPFEISQSIDTNQLDSGSLEPHLVSPIAPLQQMPPVIVDDQQVARFATGHLWEQDCDVAESESEVCAVDQHGNLITILKRKNEKHFKPSLNFSNYWLDQTT